MWLRSGGISLEYHVAGGEAGGLRGHLRQEWKGGGPHSGELPL